MKLLGSKIFLIYLIFISCGCVSNPGYNWETFPVRDVVVYPIPESGICLNYNLDSLVGRPVWDDIYVVDLHSRTPLFFGSLLSGMLEIEKIESTEYAFWISAYFEEKAHRNSKGFLRVARYYLKIFDTSYEFGLDRSFTPEMKPNLAILDSLLAMPKDTMCHAEDCELAADCIELIEALEYDLFAAIINGNMQYLSFFQNFRRDYPCINTGVWSEDFAGNERILMSIAN